MPPLTIKRLTIYPLAIPLKRRVAHAAAQRVVSEPIVAAIELRNGIVGYGETLPRSYVTGEDNNSVLAALRGPFVKDLLEFRPDGFPVAVEAIDALPLAAPDGTPWPAARAALELALLDAYGRAFERTVSDVVGWMGLAGFGHPGSTRTIRYSGVLASESVAGVRKTLRLLRLFGLRHFKLKVGFPDDEQRLAAVMAIIGRRLRRGAASLRLDANGGWSYEVAADRLRRWSDLPLAGVEQPLPPRQYDELLRLREATGVRLIHDEDLVTMADAERLYSLGVADGFNIRISKCGGLLPALRLAEFARTRGVLIQMGCMVGETSILSAAGLRFLENTPGVRFAEGCFGSFLLTEDVTNRRLRFRYGGRLPRIGPAGLGCTVLPEQLERLCLGRPIVIEL